MSLKRKIFACALIFVSGIAATQLRAQDVQTIVARHMACVFASAAKLDDGQIDPKKLARAIQPLCRGEHSAAMAATGGDAANSEVELDHTWAAVLVYRSRVTSPGR